MLRRVLAAGAALVAASSFLPEAPAGAVDGAEPVLVYADLDRLVMVDENGDTEVVSDIDGLVYNAVAIGYDGTRLAFTAGPTSADLSLYTMVLGSGEPPKRIVDGVRGVPVWPDAEGSIAFSKVNADGTADLQSISPGGELHRDITLHGDVPVPSGSDCDSNRAVFPYGWTPDARVVLAGYSATCFEISFSGIGYAASADGHFVPLVEGEQASLSPDGSAVAFSDDGGVAVMSAFGGVPARLGAGSMPSWSPLGSAVTFVRDNDVWVAPDGAAARRVESSPTRAGLPRYSADGTDITFVGEDDSSSRLFVTDVATGAVEQVSAPDDDRVLGFALVPGVQVRRLAGSDRYATAVAIAHNAFPEGIDDAVLARGDDFADALAAAGPAGAVRNNEEPWRSGAAILLTPRDQLPAVVATALERLGVERVRIVGGPDVVSAAVEASVREHVDTVTRVAGNDRYETAARLSFPPSLPLPTAVLANGERFPDALAAGPLAYSRHYPTLLTRRDALPAVTVAAIRDQHILQVIVVGGTEAVSQVVVDQLEALPVGVFRVAGTTRYETAAQLATFFFGVSGIPVREVTLARGDTFPDAVAGAPLGGRGAPTLFTDGPHRLGDATRAWLEDHAGTIVTLRVLGDTEAVSDAVVGEALAILSG